MSFQYFAYGSNIGVAGLAAKGVKAEATVSGRLRGWQLRFDVPSAFPRLEGGVANIVESGEDVVLGSVHQVADEAAPILDAIEARGVLYERQLLEVELESGECVSAEVYVGLAHVREEGLRPSPRYLRILVEGGVSRGLDPGYVDRLRAMDTHRADVGVPFRLVDDGLPSRDRAMLARRPDWVALHGVVFDLEWPRPEHMFVRHLFGGRDATPGAVAMITGDPDLRDPMDQEIDAYLQALQWELAEEYQVVACYATK